MYRFSDMYYGIDATTNHGERATESIEIARETARLHIKRIRRELPASPMRDAHDAYWRTATADLGDWDGTEPYSRIMSYRHICILIDPTIESETTS